eukprot:g32245.t1
MFWSARPAVSGSMENLQKAYHSSLPEGELVEEVQSDGSFFQKAFKRYPPEKFIALVESHGIKYHEKKLGQLFCNKSARQIECLAASVDVYTEAECLSVSAASASGSEAGRFRVVYSKEEETKELHAEAVVVACGGLSYAKTCGATDLAQRLARSFDLKVSGVRPGLVPLRLDPNAWTRSLTGVSLQALGLQLGLVTDVQIDAMAMRVTAVFLSGKLCVLDVMPDITIGDLKEELKVWHPIENDVIRKLSTVQVVLEGKKLGRGNMGGDEMFKKIKAKVEG